MNTNDMWCIHLCNIFQHYIFSRTINKMCLFIDKQTNNVKPPIRVLKREGGGKTLYGASQL